MLRMRHVMILLGVLFPSAASFPAEVSIGVRFPHVSIGINLPAYPELVVVPGYPVYYAPRLDANYFFYDGMYWVFLDDYWYTSFWYNGPWELVYPEDVPVFILRIPVRYYHRPPPYFRVWRADAPPRWGEHWGHDWERRRRGWDSWNRNAVPPPAPLPAYQRQYPGNRYPRRFEQQQELNRQNYHYQPSDPVVRRHYQAQGAQGGPAPAQRETQGAPRERSPRSDTRRSTPPPPPVQQSEPIPSRTKPPQREERNVERPTPSQEPPPQHRGRGVQERGRQPQGEVQGQPSPDSQRREEQPKGIDGGREPQYGPEQGQPRGQGQRRPRKQEQGQGQEQSQGQGQGDERDRGRGRNE